MSPWEDDGLRAGRQILTLVNANGGHTITGLVSLAPHQERALGLCMACGLALEVLYTARGPIVTGRIRSERCAPHRWWERDVHAKTLPLLALLARRDPAFLAHQLAAYGRGRGVVDDDVLAKAVHLSIRDVHRLELYPAVRPPFEPPGAGVVAMARVIGTAPAHLGAVLTEAQQVLEAETAPRVGEEREAEIAQAQAQLAAADQAAQRARAHLDGLLGLATTPVAGGR